MLSGFAFLASPLANALKFLGEYYHAHVPYKTKNLNFLKPFLLPVITGFNATKGITLLLAILVNYKHRHGR